MKVNLSSAIFYKGKEFPSVCQLAKELNVNPSTLVGRIQRGWPEERWSTKHVHCKRITYQGKEFPRIMDLALHLGVDTSVLSSRIKNWPEERWGEPVRCRTIDWDKRRKAEYLRLEKMRRSCGYSLADLPEDVQEVAFGLARALSVDPATAYALMVEKLV